MTFGHTFWPKYSFAAAVMILDQMSVDYLVLCSNDQDGKKFSKIGDYAWHNVLSGYR